MIGRAYLALATAFAMHASGCTLLLSGSQYTGGDADASDGGVRDAGTDAFSGDAAIACAADAECADDQRCVGRRCTPCDGDGDGFVIAVCREGLERVDCDDTDPLVYPNAPPICDNGVDDACNAVLPGLPFDEIGYFGTQTIPPPPLDAPDRLRVFMGADDEVLLLFQAKSDSATPYVARPRLQRAHATSAAPIPLADVLGAVLPEGRARFDAQRDDAGNVRVAMLFDDGVDELDLLQATFPGATFDPPSDAAREIVAPLTPLSDPALVVVGALPTYHLFLAAMQGGEAAAVRIDLANGSTSVVSGTGLVDPTRTWGVSGRTVGIVPGMDATLAWSGPTLPSVTDTLAIMDGARANGRPAVIEIAPNGATRRIVFVTPLSVGIRLAVYECPVSSPLSACTTTVSLEQTYLARLAPDAPLTVLPTSPTGVAILHVLEGDGPRQDTLAIGLVDAGGTALPELMPSIDVPTLGAGPVRDVSVDFRVVSVGAMGGIEVTTTFAYIRQIPGDTSSIYTGGARVCVGVGGT